MLETRIQWLSPADRAERWSKMRDISNDDTRPGRIVASTGEGPRARTGRDILRQLTEIPELAWREAQTMMTIAIEDREADARDHYDLR